jgi:hypothetical protein
VSKHATQLPVAAGLELTLPEHALLVAHIAVLGYWLGSELVINSTYRYVCWASSMSFEARDKLMDHVLHVDQHVRYALVLQVGLGATLAALYGYVPGGSAAAAVAVVGALSWLALVEVTHRMRKRPLGRRLAAIDRALRYVLMAALAATGMIAVTISSTVPVWLAWKLLMFAGVMACGVGIRFSIMDFFRTWAIIKRDGSSDDSERRIRYIYGYGTAILVGLWVLIAGIVIVSVWR